MELLEVGGLAVGALFLSISTLLSAVNTQTTRATFTGLGYGIWALVALAVGFKVAFAQRASAPSGATDVHFPHPYGSQVSGTQGVPGQVSSPGIASNPAPLWFCAGFGILLFAIGSALAVATATGSAGSILAGGIISGIGCGLVVVALAVAQHTRAFPGVPPVLVAGLVVLAASSLYQGVASYIAAQPLTGFSEDRVLLTIASVLYAVAAGILIAPGVAQIQRIDQTPARYGPQAPPPRPARAAFVPTAPVAPIPYEALAPPQGAPGPATAAAPAAEHPASPAPATTQATTARPVAFCSQCGTARPAGARFCRSCGAPFGTTPAAD